MITFPRIIVVALVAGALVLRILESHPPASMPKPSPVRKDEAKPAPTKLSQRTKPKNHTKKPDTTSPPVAFILPAAPKSQRQAKPAADRAKAQPAPRPAKPWNTKTALWDKAKPDRPDPKVSPPKAIVPGPVALPRDLQPKPRKPQPKPSQKPSPKQAPKIASVRGAAAVQQGEILLSMMEKGTMAAISLNWPRDPGRRNRIYQILSACYGVLTVLQTANNSLYRWGDPSGQAWDFDHRRYSKRFFQGTEIPDEQGFARRIARHHGISGDSRRLTPRRVWAHILVALQTHVPDLVSRKSVNGQWHLTGGKLSIRSILRDGKAVAGVITPAPLKTNC